VEIPASGEPPTLQTNLPETKRQDDERQDDDDEPEGFLPPVWRPNDARPLPSD
jgi:hypothetical protein